MTDTAIWEVQIEGHLRDLERLARDFPDSPAVAVKRGSNGEYLLSCSDFQSCQDVDAVRDCANEKLAVLSGILRLAHSLETPLISAAVWRQHPGGRRDAFVSIKGAVVRCEVGVVTVATSSAGGIVQTHPAQPARSVRLEVLASTDTAVRKVLRLIGAGDLKDWGGLYRLLEIVEEDSAGVVRRGWSSARQLKRFEHTANSVSAGGDRSRHGIETTRPPSNPMSIEEAGAYINSLLESWLRSKGI